MHRLVYFIAFYCSILISYSQNKIQLPFIENKGQWEDNILYRTPIPNGHMYFTNDSWWYQFSHSPHHHKEEAHNHNIFKDSTNRHNIKYELVGGNFSHLINKNKSTYYENFFLSTDSNKWVSNVSSYNNLIYKNVYPGISLEFKSHSAGIKYDFIVEPNASPESIKIKINGANAQLNKNGQIEIKSDITTIIEDIPYAYQIINGDTIEIAAKYHLDGSTISFILGKYNKTETLIIDPNVIFISYTGSIGTNLAHTTTYDKNHCLIQGLEAKHDSFYTTPGAYKTGKQAAKVVISKFNQNGTGILFSTYFSASNALSMEVDENNDLYFGGLTEGGTPTTSNAYMNYLPVKIQNASNTVTGWGYIAKINSTGTNLLNCTIFGGNSWDNVNSVIENLDILSEMAIDYNPIDQTIWAAMTTKSSNIPVTSNALRSTIDSAPVVLFQLDKNLSTLLYSTYIKGNNLLTINDITVVPHYNSVYFCGTTRATDIGTANTLNPTYLGGDADGFISRYNYQTNTITTTYMGTNDMDRALAITFDSLNNRLFIAGMSHNGQFQTTPNALNTPNGVNTIYSLNPTLDTLIDAGKYSTESRFYPLGINTSKCSGIGLTGLVYHISTPTDLFIPANAYQTTQSALYSTNIKKDLSGFLYATYVGNDGNHTHGGQFSIDDTLNAYNSVCEMASATVGTPGAHAVSPLTVLDIIASKIDLFVLDRKLDVKLNGSATDTFCGRGDILFINNSYNFDEFIWDLGNGIQQVGRLPTASFERSGTYRIRVVGINNFCNFSDTAYFTVNIKPLISFYPSFTDTVICYADSLLINLNPYPNIQNRGSLNSLWQPSNALLYHIDDYSKLLATETSKNITVTIPYQVQSDYCIVDTSYQISITRPIIQTFQLVPDTITMCENQDGFFEIHNGNKNYIFPETNNYSYDESTQKIKIKDIRSRYFTLTQIDSNSCAYSDSSFINIEPTFEINAGVDILTKLDQTITLQGNTDAPQFYWQDHNNRIFGTNNMNPQVTVSNDGYYILTVDDFPNCNENDTVFVFTSSIGLPNAFSPNGDGLNDRFGIHFQNDKIQFLHLFIFNRFGEMVFRGNTINDSWDGLHNGKPAEFGVYYYELKYKIGEEEYSDKGDVTLIR